MRNTDNTLPETPYHSGLGLMDLLLLGVALIWGANFVILKRAFQDLSPITTNALRLLLASILLTAIARRGKQRPFQSRDRLRAIGAGAVGFGLGQVCLFTGMNLAPAGQAALLSAMMPIFVAIVGQLTGTENLSRRTWVGITICLVGVAFVVGGPDEANRVQATVGSILVLASALFWSLSTVTLVPLVRNYPIPQVTAYFIGTGAAVFLVIALPGALRENWQEVSPAVWLGIAFSGVFALAVSNIIWNRGIRLIGAARTAAYANLSPVTAAIGGWLYLGERLTPVQIVGAVIILGGLYMVRMAKTK